MRLKKSLETSWNSDGEQLRELKKTMNNKILSLFRERKFPFFFCIDMGDQLTCKVLLLKSKM